MGRALSPAPACQILGRRSQRLAVGAFVSVLGLGGGPGPLSGQVPDTLVVPVVGDSLASDSAASALAALGLSDTIPDSLRVVNLPVLPAPAAREPERMGVRSWDREALLFAPGLSLADLLRDVPGLRILQAGDYGAPFALAGFGAAAGRVRVFQDGIELLPLEGGVVDLSLIGLSGLDGVRVVRSLGGTDIELESRRFEDPRPYTQIEAGTGDLDTNFFRGTFALPRAPGGSLLLTIDRIDTQGRENDDPGTVNGVLARYTLSPSDRFGVDITLLKRSAERSVYEPLARDRTDWSGRIRFAPTSAVTLGAFAATSKITTEDSLQVGNVRQVGLEMGWAGESGAVRSSARRLDGDGLPTWTLDASATVRSERAGGAAASVRRESWEGQSARRLRLGGWTAPLLGFSLFAEVDRGGSALPARGWTHPADSAFGGFPSDPQGIDERATTRWGVAFERERVVVRAARVRVDADSLYRLGLPFDAGEGAVPGGVRSGWETEAQIPLLLFDGLSAFGSGVRWEEEMDWPYAPRLQYQAGLRFHDTFLPTGNFELLVELGVRERETMLVFGPSDPTSGEATLISVPFHQSWFARLHMRIVSVQLFVLSENLSVRGENQDFSERLLPQTRTYYGVRWGLWN